MAIERFDTAAGPSLFRIGRFPEDSIQQMFRNQGILLEVPVTTTGVNTIQHGLGRVPRGCRIINSELPAGTGTDCKIWREVGDDAWSVRALTIRCSVADARLLLEVF